MTVATPKSPGGKRKGRQRTQKGERGERRGEETVKGKRGRREGGEGVNLPTIIEWSSLRKMLLGFMSL